jgi:hypothetical protein
MNLHPSITFEDFKANLAEVERSFGNAKLANTEENTSAVLDWLDKNTQHADGKGVLPTVQNLKRCIAELHRAGELAWITAPRTQQEIRDAEEKAAKDNPKNNLTFAEIQRQTAEAKYVATTLAALRKTSRNVRGRSHAHSAKIQAGLTQLLDKFVADHGGTVEHVTVKEADAFSKVFMDEERRFQEAR